LKLNCIRNGESCHGNHSLAQPEEFLSVSARERNDKKATECELLIAGRGCCCWRCGIFNIRLQAAGLTGKWVNAMAAAIGEGKTKVATPAIKAFDERGSYFLDRLGHSLCSFPCDAPSWPLHMQDGWTILFVRKDAGRLVVEGWWR
jgi:hypothetical protein